MQLLRFFLAATLLSVVSFESSAETVRVRLFKALTKVQVTGLGISLEGRNSPFQTIAVPRMQSMTVLSRKVSGENIWQIRYDEAGEVLRLKGNKLSISGDMIRVGIEPAPRQLQLFQRDDGTIDVITIVDLESYLAGVLPSEMPASWPIEALKAQAVAIRSYAMDVMKERSDWHFHLESSIHDQVFRIINDVGATPEIREKIQRVLTETRGQYLARNGQAIRAFYHADCGGQTEDAGLVWGLEKKSATVRDAGCPLSPLAVWHHEISRSELRLRLAEFFALRSLPRLKGLNVASRTPSGRIANLEVVFEGQPVLSIGSNDFRRLVGFNELKSTNFSLRWFGEKLLFEGKGHGHGVGLCQYGARYLAARGLGYQAILKHYYPQAILARQVPANERASTPL